MNDYHQRINRVMDYIDQHLSENLTLESLAEIACFSRYHFHRIFQMVRGERLFEYIQRLRLEKSAQLLSGRPDLPVIDIALLCGFSNPASFSRAFKERFSCSPSQWRKKHPVSNLSIVERNESKEDYHWASYAEYGQKKQRWVLKREEQQRVVETRNLEPVKLVYNRYSGPYMGDGALFQKLWDQLCSWAGPRGLISKETEYMSMYMDDPELTEEQKLRVTLAMTVKKCPQDQTMGYMEWQGGLYGCSRFRLNEREYGEAWDWMFREWLPRSGFLPDDRPALERYLPDGDEDPHDGRHSVEICIPLLPA